VPVAVDLRRVRFGYEPGRAVLEDVDLRVETGEFVAIAGPNGGGKTTLLRIVLGLERPTAGEALLFGEPADRLSRRARIAYLPQRARLGVSAPATVREVVAAGRVAGGGLLGPLRRRDRAVVAASIARVGLSDRADEPLRTLSGGRRRSPPSLRCSCSTSRPPGSTPRRRRRSAPCSNASTPSLR
jgi:zinc transport system ATP-binding protein